MNKPRSINIFLLHGDPNGIRVAQISMSTIQAIAFRRNQLKEVCKSFPEIQRPGVYILIGIDENSIDRHLYYVGESESVAARLTHHIASDKKDFWTDTVVLISKDENLTKSHARYVESRLIYNINNPRWGSSNAQNPSNEAGKLPLPDRAAMDEFIDQTQTLVSALGWDLFRDIRGQQQNEPAENQCLQKTETKKEICFNFSGDGYSANMEIGPSGDFIVKEGSKARIKTSEAFPKKAASIRSILFEKKILEKQDNYLLFTSDYSFSSVTAAAATVIGSPVNGRTAWKLPDNSTYAEWEAHQEQHILTNYQ